MLWLAVIFGVGVVSAKLADFEERTPWGWGIAGSLATYVLTQIMGDWWALAPVVTLVLVFVALWVLRSGDDRRRRGRRVVR